MLLAEKPSSRPAHGPVAFASMPGGRTGLRAGASSSSRKPPADGTEGVAVAMRPHLRPGKTHATESQSARPNQACPLLTFTIWKSWLQWP